MFYRTISQKNRDSSSPLNRPVSTIVRLTVARSFSFSRPMTLHVPLAIPLAMADISIMRVCEQLAKESCAKKALSLFFNGTCAFSRMGLLYSEGCILELMKMLHTVSRLRVMPVTMKNFGWSMPSKFCKKTSPVWMAAVIISCGKSTLIPVHLTSVSSSISSCTYCM